MQRILVIKMSSMGDVIHALPAITDAGRAYPGLDIDWVVDQHFAEIPAWHRNVRHCILTHHRDWKKNWFRAWQSGSIQSSFRALRAHTYDAVIDLQSNLRSALITRLAHGTRHGYDRAHVREYGAHWAYQHHHAISTQQHAILRMRQLMAQALNYTVPTGIPDSGLVTDRFIAPALPLPSRYLLFIPNTSWTSKAWPDPYWSELLSLAVTDHHDILIPAGNAAERARAERLRAPFVDRVHILPKLSLSEMAYVIQHTRIVVSLDTGLTHLTAALQTPSVSLYGSTDAHKIGTLGPEQIHMVANFPCSPCSQRRCTYRGASEVSPACYSTIPPEAVWEQVRQQL